jgi:hypothetical protein
MTRRGWILAAVLAAACHFKPTPTPEPPTPTLTAMRAIAVVITANGVPMTGAAVTLTDADSGTVYDCGACVTDRDGYAVWLVVPIGHTVVGTATRDGYVAGQWRATLEATTADWTIALAPIAPPAPTDDELHHVLANFCNLRDAQGRVIFTADYAGLDDATRADWRRRLVAAGSTHLVVSPSGGGYPGTPFTPFDLRGDPARFAVIVREILATTGANGKALTPILILDGGEPGFRDRVRADWPGIRQALGADVERVLVVPGWELVKASDATSADYAFALTFLHDQGWPHIWAHLSPGRASASSNPIEADDPWQGAESGMWKSHGGEFVEGLLYQSEAVRPNDDRCDPADDGCWLNRWEDVVPRIGAGMNGWRIIHLAYFEGPAYYYYRGQSDDAFARRIATAAQSICQKYNVRCGFGNGLPEAGR